jgi:hypothetical protein
MWFSASRVRERRLRTQSINRNHTGPPRRQRQSQRKSRIVHEQIRCMPSAFIDNLRSRRLTHHSFFSFTTTTRSIGCYAVGLAQCAKTLKCPISGAAKADCDGPWSCGNMVVFIPWTMPNWQRHHYSNHRRRLFVVETSGIPSQFFFRRVALPSSGMLLITAIMHRVRLAHF